MIFDLVIIYYLIFRKTSFLVFSVRPNFAELVLYDDFLNSDIAITAIPANCRYLYRYKYVQERTWIFSKTINSGKNNMKFKTKKFLKFFN